MSGPNPFKKGPECFADGFAYRHGRIIPIEQLMEIGLFSGAHLARLEARGLRHYCSAQDGMSDLLESCVAETLERSCLTAEQIDVIVFANSSSQWTQGDESEFYRSLRRLGFQKCRIAGMMLNGCSASGASFRMAQDIIGGSHSVETTLIILFGKVVGDLERLPQGANTIFSDGVASCVVSILAGGLRVLSADSSSDIAAAAALKTTSFGEHIQNSFADLSRLVERLYRESGITSRQVKKLFATNGSNIYLDWIANAAEVEPRCVHRADVERFAHVHSCDNLISLRNHLDLEPASPGDYFFLLSWSPYVVSGVILAG